VRHRLLWALASAFALALACAAPAPPPGRPPSPNSGVGDELPQTYWWYAPADQACPAFHSARACRRAMPGKRCVQRRGLRYPCGPTPER
jgi:hypothetical protein